MRSTRSEIRKDAYQAILEGLSEDGGLYVFESLHPNWYQKDLLGKSYSEIAFLCMKELLNEWTEEEIHSVVNASYNSTNFQEKIIGLDQAGQFTYLTLYHGNTFAFKDLALSTLPNLMKVAKERTNNQKHTVILTATSGDTGSAALSGFSKSKDTTVIVLYPNEGVSPFQELQMTNYRKMGHYTLAVDGNFDDCQRLVKELFVSLDPKNLHLSSANSINIGRLIPQVIYYVVAYTKLVEQGEIEFGDKINITVPTGNFGNIYSALVAKRLGVPIQKLIVASNKNNVLTDVFRKEEYLTNRPLHKTISPSMDILVSSNLERFLFDTYGFEFVQKAMLDLKTEGRISLPDLNKASDFSAYYTTEEQTKETIRRVFNTTHYLIDPHTAVAVHAAEEYIQETKDETKMMIVSTANPYKFSRAMTEALDLNPYLNLAEEMHQLEEYSGMPIDPRIKKLLTNSIDRFVVSKEKAFDTVKQIVGEINASH